MQRHTCQPRPDWRTKVEEVGLTFHSHEQGPYWDESACYELTAAEVDALEKAGHALHYLCIDAAEAVIVNNWWPRLGIPEIAVPVILRSWERDDFSLYGRFDLGYDGHSSPKLLEYNADTPTSLIETSVAQWFWLQDTRPGADQFNSVHERLIEAWRRCGAVGTPRPTEAAGRAGCPSPPPESPCIHFSGIKEHDEDQQTVLYIRDTCEQAGVKTKPVFIEDIGWDEKQSCFVDLDNEPITRCFKLYPWEWLWHEEFGQYLDCSGASVKRREEAYGSAFDTNAATQFIEPTWKMLLSNKGLLPILWELFPDHPNLLPAYDDAAPLGGSFVRKPKLSREGANVAWFEGGVAVEETDGDYGWEGHVFQAPAAMPEFDGNRPVFGVWIVDHEPAGLGIREDTRRITGNLSRFIPHFFQ